ncbi:DNA mismatch repair endonuclease MutL [Pumilibacter muris]|uniref:DNA mismatch repair endonuclease MutL n=1 Tax=Pumilibacter muris TaxID=2941510 RepID=UPI0020409071|nr:DNA mismatch repair endonuclease MutL [Pumilibacter muris]
MSKINILDSSVFNRIAAGEVVENPKSVIKELVENSIDSGATSIAVEIRGGGIEYICVTDNGKGITKDDLPVAFMPHATSKISNIKDLENISTLGFRGEALPSIASVAEVEMASRTQDTELGYKIALVNGKIESEGECGIPYGTKVTVRNLFKNVPARAKFLKKPQMEESAVTEFISKIILSNPFLKIKYIVNRNTELQSDGNGIESAILTVYGEHFLQNLTQISYNMPDISLFGYICNPDFTKHNRTYQTLIVNGRYIINSEISYCIQQCYQNYLMKRQFPAYVLYLNIPSDMVDVNVHPNKLDVRFANEKRLKGIIYNTVKTKVDELAIAPTSFSTVTEFPFENNLTASELSAETAITKISEEPRISIEQGITSIAEPSIIRTKINNFIQKATFNKKTHISDNQGISQNANNDNTNSNLNTNETFLTNDLAESRYAGKLFNTYLFVESGENFYIIDQHAAHEKLLYDKLVAQTDKSEMAIQDLLLPYIFDVTPTEAIILSENLEQINSCGFKIDKLHGNSFSLYALPVCCCEMNFKKFISDLMNDITSKKNRSDFIKESLMQAACKSAVKGEMDLTQNEIDSLITDMQKSGSAKFCPHGRPTVIKFSKYELEKFFKRA